MRVGGGGWRWMEVGEGGWKRWIEEAEKKPFCCCGEGNLHPASHFGGIAASKHLSSVHPVAGKIHNDDAGT